MLDNPEQPKNIQEEENQLIAAENDDGIPPQYEGMSSEMVEELWRPAVAVDQGKADAQIEQRIQALARLKEKEAAEEVNERARLNNLFSRMPEQLRSQLDSARKEAMDVISSYIKQNGEIENLRPQGQFVLDKLRTAWQESQQENPNSAQELRLQNPYDQSVFQNLIDRVALMRLAARQETADKQAANEVRASIGLPEQGQTEPPKEPKPVEKTLSLQERKALYGWKASYELARIAKARGIDLTVMSREEYARYAIDNALRIDDDQLRLAPEFRMITSNEEYRQVKKTLTGYIENTTDREFDRFSHETRMRAGTNDRYIQNGIRVRQGTAESSSWLFFGINQGTEPNKGEMYKSYISLKNLNQLTPQRFTAFMEALRDAGYQGDVKIFQDLKGQGAVLNDQIVMHGQNQDNSRLAMQVAEQFFGDELGQKSFGKDEVVDGKNLSYSQVMALRIKQAIEAKVV